MRVAVIGGGLCGLTCAIRLARRGFDVDLFEAASSPGGRTRSFFDGTVRQWVDNGPHLLVGAYRHTHRLLEQAGASGNIHWQPSLLLPLWELRRGLFHLAPQRHIPLALALPWACGHLPGHGIKSLSAVIRLGLVRPADVDGRMTVAQWLNVLHAPEELVRDLLSPLCLGAMNETMRNANARSFARVLKETFVNHASARLGWFTHPLQQALIEPLADLAKNRGVSMHVSTSVRRLYADDRTVELETASRKRKFDAAVLALPARGRNRLLGINAAVKTQPITNVHLWLENAEPLPEALIGGIGTCGQWFFDVSRQMGMNSSCRHICAVISAGGNHLPKQKLVADICRDLQFITGSSKAVSPVYHRIVRERHATAVVSSPDFPVPVLPMRVIDVSEAPAPGDFPATIEAAVRRGETAAKQCSSRLIP